MRRKVYTREHILKAAYELINREGFSNFTARNIAKHMGISTQPIYLEFENMQDLKNTLVEDVFKDLSENVFPVVRTGDKLVDLGLNYIRFAQEQHNLYIALFIDDYGGGKLMHDFSSTYFKSLIKSEEKYADLSEDAINALHNGAWIVVTGLASLMSAGIITPTDDQIIKIINETIEGVIEKKENYIFD
ncbi:TetR/AcrR family transcriptional regulator [Enterococcus sp.]|uniref:TetR/AcrR family transcriptional regulator n=1 Tax=Enterococcus sp. TaxID=35783 RepID=UPI0028B0AA00|nr:TetR/AcrR family transcriptional regulator [Enterococcus sp.]